MFISVVRWIILINLFTLLFCFESRAYTLDDVNKCIDAKLAPILNNKIPELTCYYDTRKDYTICKCNGMEYVSINGNIIVLKEKKDEVK